MGYSLKNKILVDAQSNDFETKHEITVYKQTLSSITWFFWKSTLEKSCIKLVFYSI